MARTPVVEKSEFTREDKEDRQILKFLRKNSALSLFLIIFTVVISQFWFFAALQSYYALIQNNNPPWYSTVLASVGVTVIYVFIVIIILKIPISLIL